MLATELLKYFFRRSSTSVSYIIQPLTNGFVIVGAGGNIQQPLVGCRILHDGLRLAVDRKHDGTLALFKLLHEVAGFAAESGQRLDVFGDVEHARPRTKMKHLIRC